LAELVDRQAYRLAYWRVADEELNYRRFFNISTLAALRVEDGDVFTRTHEVLLKLVVDGKVDGLRIDHPDGLAAPGAYLARLATETNRSWVVVEKILEGDEQLPVDWECAGTTGYDALLRAGGLLLDPAGARPLLDLYTELTGAPENFHDVANEAKRHVVRDVLHAEVTRLTALLTTISRESLALRDHTRRAFSEALIELLVHVDVYRAYVTPGEDPSPEAAAELDRASAAARQRLPEHRHATVDVVRDLALGRHGRSAAKDEFVVRFQQTCGPVMAKGVEDTAFYRWFRLSSLNEVGGDPERFGVSPQQFHDWCTLLQRTWPLTMTTLSTHDTKRSEDVRARLAVLSELPDEWGRALTSWRARSAAYRPELLDANTEYLLWQTLVGAWPIDSHRLTGYLEKATREAKWLTTWVDPDPAYDAAVRQFAESVLGDDVLIDDVAAFVERIAPFTRVNVLSQKLVQLTMPGIPDVYQGTELLNLSLVDPDNRRSVNYAMRRELLAVLDDRGAADGIDAEKLLVTSRALRVRQQHPDWFGVDGAYVPMRTTSAHAVAFARGDSVVTVAARLSAGLQRTGGWRGATVELPPGIWRDALTGRAWAGDVIALVDLLHALPVALLVRD
jgi:(1->4)-alpha-D-glucan 1-alpha-D-glucosylmutase